MSKYYRFELACFGEPWDIGFLQGLEEVEGLPPKMAGALYAPFETLNSPALDICDPAEFWFTEQGLHKFASAIDSIIEAIEPYGWSMIAGVMEDDGHKAVYQDDLQAAWYATYLETDVSQFVPVGKALDLLSMPVCK